MKILNRSLDIARKLYSFTDKKPQVFCFVYSRTKLLSVGRNDMTTENPKAIYFGKRFGSKHTIKYPFIHAEIDAISKLWGRYHITGSEKLVIVRYRKEGSSGQLRKSIVPALSKPCSNCNNIISAIGFRKVWYTTDSSWEINNE